MFIFHTSQKPFFAGLSWEGNNLKFAILKGSHINKRSWRRLDFSFAEWFDDFWRSFSANSWMMIFWMCKLDFNSKTHYHAFSRYLHDGKIQFKFTNIIDCNSSSRNATLRTTSNVRNFNHAGHYFSRASWPSPVLIQRLRESRTRLAQAELDCNIKLLFLFSFHWFWVLVAATASACTRFL